MPFRNFVSVSRTDTGDLNVWTRVNQLCTSINPCNSQLCKVKFNEARGLNEVSLQPCSLLTESIRGIPNSVGFEHSAAFGLHAIDLVTS